MDDISQILDRLASDDSRPTVEELTAARDHLAASRDELAANIKDASGSANLDELLGLKGDFDALTDGLAKVTAALDEAQAQIDAILAEVGGDDTPEDEPVEEAQAEVEPVAASVKSALARVRANPRPAAPVVETAADLSAVDTTFTLRGKERDTIAASEVGRAFSDAARTFGGAKTSVLSIKTDLHPDRVLSGDASANERKMLDLFGANPVVPVTASGGCCSIPEPIYDQPLIGSLDRPIRNSLDVLGASRGAVQAYPAVCIPDEGADVWTCAQDAAVVEGDPNTWKDCVEVVCDTPDPVLVEPIYKCLTIGTFQQKFAPEQWEAHLFQTDKLAARKAEARLFDWLVDSATSTHTGFATGSTYANMVKTLLRAAALIRQDQRLGDSQILVYGPEWIYTAIIEDTITRRLNAVEEAEIIKAKVDQVLANEGITYVGSQDIADLEAFQYDGALAAYPATAPMVMLPAGSAKVLDGGEKNLGIDITDHDLNRQNKVAAFSEFWEGLLVRACNIKELNIPVEDCDTIPCPV